MSLIIGRIESEYLELFALEFGKIAESDFVYTPASTSIDQSAPNLPYSLLLTPRPYLTPQGHFWYQIIRPSTETLSLTSKYLLFVCCRKTVKS